MTIPTVEAALDILRKAVLAEALAIIDRPRKAILAGHKRGPVRPPGPMSAAQLRRFRAKRAAKARKAGRA